MPITTPERDKQEGISQFTKDFFANLVDKIKSSEPNSWPWEKFSRLLPLAADVLIRSISNEDFRECLELRSLFLRIQSAIVGAKADLPIFFNQEPLFLLGAISAVNEIFGAVYSTSLPDKETLLKIAKTLTLLEILEKLYNQYKEDKIEEIPREDLLNQLNDKDNGNLSRKLQVLQFYNLILKIKHNGREIIRLTPLGIRAYEKLSPPEESEPTPVWDFNPEVKIEIYKNQIEEAVSTSGRVAKNVSQLSTDNKINEEIIKTHRIKRSKTWQLVQR
ncbi:MAG: hypothetical protein M1421_06330 [Candidatus Eremiobacteraeota bacterium]|nr:hypothetical protein [Candidatus Eremiobacteraeota bacterium]MCL5055853.1 hypothetical protein [Bacillota bacterium]